MNRPLVIVAFLYGAGVVLGRFLSLPLGWLFAGCFILGIAVLRVERGRALALAMLLPLFGLTNLTTRTAVLSPVDLRSLLTEEAEIATVKGTLASAPEYRVFVRDEEPSWRTMTEVHVQALRRGTDWERAFGRVAVVTPGVLSRQFFAGRFVEIDGVIQLPKRAVAPGLFDYRAYLKDRGIHYLLVTEGTNDWRLVENASSRRNPPFPDRFRAWAQQTLAKGLPEEDEPLRLLWAMVLGWKTALTDEVSEPFMRSGTLHIFAISGLHVALIAGILVALLRVLQVPRSVCGAIIIPLLWFYTAATGWQASAIRSTVMMSVIVAGWALSRPSDLINSLAAAALLILVWDPRQLFQAGFQLSFCVVLGLALIAPALQKTQRWLFRKDPLLPDELRPRWQRWTHTGVSWLLASLATSLAAWLGSAPLIAYYFNIFTPVALLANVLIVPLAGFALASSLASLLCGDWLPWFTVLFNHSAWFWMKLMVESSEWLARLPNAFFFVRSPSWLLFVAYYALLTAVLTGWIMRNARWKWAGPAVGVLLLGAILGFRASRDAITITVLPLGGSGIWIDAPGRQSDVLIDCSNASGADFVLKPFLRAQGVNRIPHLLLTHGDLQHVGGYEAIKQDFSVTRVLTSSMPFRSPAYREIVEQLEASPNDWQRVHRGDHVGPWRVLHPSAEDRFSRADDGAIVLLGEFDGMKVLLLSDLGRDGQRLLLDREPDLKADIVVTGFPAQGEPLNDDVLRVMEPKVIVLAGAEFPASAHASRRLRKRMATTAIPIVHTDQAGAATVRIHTDGWEVQTREGVVPIRTVNERP